jgi:drug/metabolite transporter (DMT)-like permease
VKAYVLGLLGVVMFGMTFPMTRLAVGTIDSPQLSPWFSALGRAAVAGVLSLIYLAASGQLQPAKRPKSSDWLPLAITAGGVVFGFPLLTAWALRYVESIHAAVLIGFLPLATAALGAWLAKQRPSIGFWLCALLGSCLIAFYAVIHQQQNPLQAGAKLLFHPADALLVLAVLCAAIGYAYGAILSAHLGGQQVICWTLVISLPITIPAGLYLLPQTAIQASAWLGFGYISIFSMWLGFFAWYKALALGGTVRISQIQLLQPLFSIAFAVPILGERLDLTTLVFALAVIATVFMGKKMPVSAI